MPLQYHTIVDISLELDPKNYAMRTPAGFKKDMQFEMEVLKEHDAPGGAGQIVRGVHMRLHAGSHVDAPEHNVPGGTVATYMWDFAGGGFTQRPLIEALAATGVNVALPGQVNSRREALQGFFETAGLIDIESRSIEIEVSYPNFDDYWSAQTALANPAVQALRKMSESEVERLKARLRSTLADEQTGRIAYPARANAIKGRVPA